MKISRGLNPNQRDYWITSHRFHSNKENKEGKRLLILFKELEHTLTNVKVRGK